MPNIDLIVFLSWGTVSAPLVRPVVCVLCTRLFTIFFHVGIFFTNFPLPLSVKPESRPTPRARARGASGVLGIADHRNAAVAHIILAFFPPDFVFAPNGWWCVCICVCVGPKRRRGWWRRAHVSRYRVDVVRSESGGSA